MKQLPELCHSGMQVKDTLGAIAARFKALHIGGGGLFVGRLTGSHARPLTLKSVVRYSPNWVKNQNRMASTSNQETYRTDVDGRLVFDILRQVSPYVCVCMHATQDACCVGCSGGCFCIQGSFQHSLPL